MEQKLGLGRLPVRLLLWSLLMWKIGDEEKKGYGGLRVFQNQPCSLPWLDSGFLSFWAVSASVLTFSTTKDTPYACRGNWWYLRLRMFVA